MFKSFANFRSSGVQSRNLHAGLLQAAGSSKSVTRVDQSTAIEAIRNVESRLRSAEDEVSDFKLKVISNSY